MSAVTFIGADMYVCRKFLHEFDGYHIIGMTVVKTRSATRCFEMTYFSLL